jgi:hypothetical protein
MHLNNQQPSATESFTWLVDIPQITIVGFSLTGYGNPSFGAFLQSKLRATGWSGSVKEISYGGLSINALSGLLEAELALLTSNGLLILELSTSFYSLHKYTVQDAIPFVSAIAKLALESSQRMFCFLNLYRHDLDDNDCVVEAIDHIATTYAAPVLDLKTSFRSLYTSKTFGVDGIHPDSTASELIAHKIYTFLGNGPWTHVAPSATERYPDYEYLDLVPLLQGLDVFHYEARGATMRASIALPGSQLSIRFNRVLEVVGYYFLYGPETGFVNIALDDQATTELITFDEHSYYRRIGFRPLRLSGSTVTISVPPKTRSIVLVKQTNLATAGRREFLCGFLTHRPRPLNPCN